MWLKTADGTTLSRDGATPAPTALEAAADTSLEDLYLFADADTDKHAINKKIETP
jgi:hypothetical protein